MSAARNLPPGSDGHVEILMKENGVSAAKAARRLRDSTTSQVVDAWTP